MVTIPSGTFPTCSGYGAGDPAYPGTSVTGFFMGKYEVTNHEYKYFQDSAGGHWGGSGTIPDNNYPVVYVSFNDAAAYCNWLSDKCGLFSCYTIDGSGNVTAINTTQNGYRLPDDIEWEYACRAGTGTDYFWGDNYSPGYPNTPQETTNINTYCWYQGNSGFVSHPVGSLTANPWGLYDMSGNVWEWDNRMASGTRIIRSSYFSAFSDQCKSSSYNGYYPDQRDHFGIGFRLVKN